MSRRNRAFRFTSPSGKTIGHVGTVESSITALVDFAQKEGVKVQDIEVEPRKPQTFQETPSPQDIAGAEDPEGSTSSPEGKGSRDYNPPRGYRPSEEDREWSDRQGEAIERFRREY